MKTSGIDRKISLGK